MYKLVNITSVLCLIVLVASYSCVYLYCPSPKICKSSEDLYTKEQNFERKLVREMLVNLIEKHQKAEPAILEFFDIAPDTNYIRYQLRVESEKYIFCTTSVKEARNYLQKYKNESIGLRISLAWLDDVKMKLKNN